MVAQAEIWLMETPNQKRRPVLVVSRDEAIPVLDNIVVAPATSVSVAVDESARRSTPWPTADGTVRFALTRVAVLLVGALVVGGCTSPASFHDPIVLEVTRDGPRAPLDDSIDRQFAQGLDVPSDAVWVAACHASVGVEVSQSLSSSVAVVADAGYVRVAEMVIGGEVTSEEAVAIESAVFAEPSLVDDPTRLPSLTQIPIGRVREYLDLRSRAPETDGRYLAYVHNLTMRIQRLIIIDVERFRDGLGNPPELYVDSTIRVAGQEPVEVEPDACETFKQGAE